MQELLKDRIDRWASLLFISIAIGVIVSGLDVLFGRVLLWLIATSHELRPWIFLLLGPAGLIFMFFFLRYGKESVQGMNLVFKAGHGEDVEIPKRLVIFVTVGTWITHFFGGSAGREGVAIQIGGTIGQWFGSLSKRIDHREFVVIGMAAGFSGLFQTPIAATFFALEVLVVGRMRYQVLIPTLVASFISSSLSHLLRLEKFHFEIVPDISITPIVFVKLVICGILFGLCGALFAYLLKKGKQLTQRVIPSPMLRILIVGALVGLLILLFFNGRYASLGMNLIEGTFSSEAIYRYDWLLKLLLTVITLSAGFQGGEVTPLFAIGTTLGVVLASVLGLPVLLIAALGYASVFGSATNTILAPIFIGAEVFGYETLPFFFIACAFSYAFNFNQSIYGQQKIAWLEK
ncbi:chloride channel protein [Enterococcus bulliens]